jgi:hypothetical protein
VRSWGDLRRLPAWGVAALIVLAPAACSDAATAPADPPPAVSVVTPTSSGTASATTTAPPAPVLPFAAKQPTRPGAEAFFRYFMDAYNYGYDALDPNPLRAISGTSCSYCANAVRAIEDAKRLNLNFHGGNIVVHAAVAAPGNPATGMIVNAIIDQSTDEIVDAQGTVKGTEPGEQNQRIDAALRWNGTSWQAIGIHVLVKGAGN